ncbi:MAG: class I SAM-dependent methyltransferase [Gammaproteobacteria bacterium]|nr:class I SAM-dependent methyltransferase [Gammaproteobacteria bacterium]
MLNTEFNEPRKQYSTLDLNLRLQQAASVGDEEEVKQLLDTHPLECDYAQFGINPDTNEPYCGRTALHLAALNKHEGVCQTLLNHGWSPMKKDANGKTVLSLADSPSIQHLLNHYYATEGIFNHLKDVFEQLGLLDHLPQKNPHTLRVLSLGCGEAYEFLCLTTLYPHIHWEFVGVDNDAEVIHVMKQRFPTLPHIQWNCLDATDEVQMQTLVPGRFDIVFIRQPNIINMPEVFTAILSNILPMKIKPDGMLFMSTYHHEELLAAFEVIRENFHSLTRNNFCEFPNCEISINGDILHTDGYSVVLSPTPALQSRIAAEAAEKVNHADSSVTNNPLFNSGKRGAFGALPPSYFIWNPKTEKTEGGPAVSNDFNPLPR